MTLLSHRNAVFRRLGAAPATTLLLLACCLLKSGPVLADTATRFVEQLRAEGHGDLVLEYLDRAADDPLVSDAFRERIPYERLATSAAEAFELKDPRARIAALEAIQADLRKLASERADAKRLLTDVTDRVATASAETARRAALQAERNPVASERAAQRKAARSAIDAARRQLASAEELIVDERARLKGSPPASAEGRRGVDLGVRLGLVRLLRARLLHEQAETYPDKSSDRKRLNEDAAKQLGELYEKYAKWGVGLYAHLYEGRCYRLLGEKQLAAAALEDLTAQPASTPDLRRIVTLAHAELAALRLDNGDAQAALDKPAAWLKGLASDERKGPEAATLRYRLGVAALALAEKSDDGVQRRLRREARDWLAESARVPSEVQADARDRWAEATASLGLEAKPPESFDEAMASANEAIQSMLAFNLAMEGAVGDEAERLAGQRRDSFDAAYAALEAAVKMADDKTDPDKAGQARYQLAWLDWDSGDAEKAATRAEYVARRDADTPSGKKAARLAMAALERRQREGAEDAAPRLREMANFSLAQWPNSDIAEAASTVLVSDALRTGDLAAAESLLAKAPKEQRAELALRLAVSQWERAKSSPEGSAGALATMREAFETATRGGDASPLAVTAALYLAEAALDAGDAQQASKLLDHAGYGPAIRVAANEAPANSPAFALASLKSMARAKALAGKDAAEDLERFAKVLSGSPPAATGGDRAWLGLAVALQGDLELVSDKPIVAQVAATLSAVLERLGDVVAGGDWNTRLWVAQARLRAGESLADEQASRSNLEAGRAAFAELIERAESQPGFAPSETSVLAARLKLAECERELGEYSGAIETLTKMLSGGAVLLDVQREAAETLQEWGQTSKSAERLEEAIAGARPGNDGKNLIWGWSKLAAVAGRFAGSDPKRRPLYFQAWRHVAESRYQAALLAEGAERAEQLRKAASTVQAVRRKNPELGGPESKRAFDRLLREIQGAAGQPADGLSQAGG